MVEIHHKLLSKEALDNILIDYLTRQSVDNEAVGVSLEQRKKKIIHLLDKGEVVIVYSLKEEHCSIISRSEWREFS